MSQPDTYEWTLNCPPLCTFRPGTPFSDRVTLWLLKRRPYRAIIGALHDAGQKTNLAVLTRHKKHITVQTTPVMTALDPDSVLPPPESRATNIEILETIIQRGFANSKQWKPTISDTMKAMDMWFRLTQGNPFDELLDTLASAGLGAENPEASAPAAERVLADDDEEGESDDG